MQRMNCPQKKLMKNNILNKFDIYYIFKYLPFIKF